MSSSSTTPAQYNGLNPADYKPGTVAPCEVCGRNWFRSPNSKEGFRCKDHTFAAMELAALEAKEQDRKQPKTVKGKRPKSLTIKVQEMEKYDWNPSMRFLLLILVLGTRKAKDDYSDTWVAENSPWTAEEMVGWCDMAQWRLAQRVGLTEGRINDMLAQLELDGFIRKEEWTDPDTETIHCRYQVVEVTVDANQRKEHSRNVKRGPRYGKERKANKGSFSKSNQPKMTALQRAIREEDDE